MIFHIHDHIETSPEFHFRFRFRNSEGSSFGNHIVSLRFNFCVNGIAQVSCDMLQNSVSHKCACVTERHQADHDRSDIPSVARSLEASSATLSQQHWAIKHHPIPPSEGPGYHHKKLRWAKSPIANRWRSANAVNSRRPFRSSTWNE